MYEVALSQLLEIGGNPIHTGIDPHDREWSGIAGDNSDL